MRSLICAVGLALIACDVGFATHIQLQGKTSGKGAVVEGTVTIKGKPAPGVVILLQASNDESPNYPSLKAKTDEEGKYRITGVPSGTYYIGPANTSFVIVDADESRAKTVVVIGGETVDGIDFELIRGGVLTGKVSDSEGSPIIEQRVFLLNTDPARAPRRAGNPNENLTDDRGIYRIFGVAPGRYKIVVGEPGLSMSRLGSQLIIQTFYPDVFEEAKASIVDVTEGSEVSNIDITAGRTAPTFSVSGQVIDGESGQPIAGARFGLQKMTNEGQRFSSGGSLTTSNSKGEFKLDGLPAGKYGIFLAPQPRINFRSTVFPFEIVDQDVTGIIIKTATGGASVSGVVVLENSEDKAVRSRLLQLSLHGYIQNSARSVGTSSAIGPDGSFSLDNLEPGSLFISLGAPDFATLKGFTVSRIEHNGIVQPNPPGIELESGDRLADVRVVVSYGNAIIHGVVKLQNGPLPAGARIFVRLLKEGLNTNFASQPVDARGRFILEGIPAGLYIIETNMYVPGSTGRPRRPARQQMNVAEGVVNEVSITLENPKPDPTSP